MTMINLSSKLLAPLRQHAHLRCITCRLYSSVAEPLSTPPPNPTERVYPEKIQRLVTDISQLTLLEVADLNQLLKTTLKLPDAPVMAVGAAMAAPAAADAEEEVDQTPQKVQTSFSVRLTGFDASKKVAIIKEIKNLMEGMNLVQAKKFVEGCPSVVRSDIGKDEAEKVKEALIAAGGSVEVE